MSTTARKPRPSHLELAQRILASARRQGLGAGARLPEQRLAEECSVSRTPVRAALGVLEAQGIAARDAEGGYRLAVDVTRSDAVVPLPSSASEDLMEAILRDRSARRLGATVTVADLMRRYDHDRRTVLKSLNGLQEDGVVARAPGQSWIFQPSPDGPDSVSQSYDFRLVVEPALLLAPGFDLDQALAATVRKTMEMLAARDDQSFDLAEFRAVDLDFHVMLARGSGNRFLSQALADHFKLRRLPGAYGGVSLYRMRQSIREHVAMLDAVESGQMDLAADLMRVHLRASRSQRPQAASKGAPSLASRMRAG